MIFVSCVLLLAGTVIAQQQKFTEITDFSGMAGCWEQRDDARNMLITEQWMSPAGTSILGMGRTVKNGKTSSFEYMRIEKRDDGIYFVSRPKENTEDTAFKLISSTGNEVVFENKEHDFPQRVIYELHGTKMTGRIEGTIGGRSRSADFPMMRTKCIA